MRDRRKTRRELDREILRLRRRGAHRTTSGTRRILPEKGLEESESMFRSLTEKSVGGVYLIQDWIFRYVNPKMAEMYGYAVNEMIDRVGPRECVLEEDWPLVRENLRRRLSGEVESFNYRFRGIKGSGEVMHVEVYGSRTEYRGRPAVIGTILDITTRVEAERNLQMQLHRFQALYHIAMAMTAEHTLEENLSLLVGKCRELIEADVSLIAVLEKQSEGLHVCAQSGLRRANLCRLPAQFLDTLESRSPSEIHGESLETCFAHLRGAAKKDFRNEGLVSGIAIQLRARNRPIGVLCVGSRSNRSFSESEKDVLCLLGNIATLEIARKQAEESLAQSENELRHLSAQLLRAQEDERKRLAQELHDGIGQSLSAIKFRIETSIKQIGERVGAVAGEQLELLVPMVQSTVEEVQRIAVDLRPFILDDLGLVATLRWFLRQFQSTYSDIRLESRIGLEEHEVPEYLKIVVFRIVQEALNNVVRHSRAERVHVSLTRNRSRLELSIEDNGVGLRAAKAPISMRGSGFGLSSMKERTELSGGTFHLGKASGVGTAIRASWPLKVSGSSR
ncbi:MAG: PAS domain S-box protein [Thermodesulfobacteriota bacterium]